MDHVSLFVAFLALLIALFLSPLLGNIGLSGGKGAVS